jgi:hypothetical protein
MVTIKALNSKQYPENDGGPRYESDFRWGINSPIFAVQQDASASFPMADIKRRQLNVG